MPADQKLKRYYTSIKSLPACTDQVRDMLEPYQVAILFVIVIAVVMLVRNRSFHEQADQLARHYCDRNGLQLLDGTVRYRGMRFEMRKLHFCRSFGFEYSLDKLDRHAGQITMCGQQVQSFRVNPDHLHQTSIDAG